MTLAFSELGPGPLEIPFSSTPDERELDLFDPLHSPGQYPRRLAVICDSETKLSMRKKFACEVTWTLRTSLIEFDEQFDVTASLMVKDRINHNE